MAEPDPHPGHSPRCAIRRCHVAAACNCTMTGALEEPKQVPPTWLGQTLEPSAPDLDEVRARLIEHYRPHNAVGTVTRDSVIGPSVPTISAIGPTALTCSRRHATRLELALLAVVTALAAVAAVVITCH